MKNLVTKNNKKMHQQVAKINPISTKTTKEIKPNNRPDRNMPKKTIKQPHDRGKPHQQYKKIDTIQPIFKNQTVYLLGGGPSLLDFDWNKLKGKNVIAINKAFLSYPDADILYWTDTRFWKWFKADIDKFKGIKVTNKAKIIQNDILILRDSGRIGLDTNPSSLKHGNNSGYAAINLAFHTGANRIMLLGYDMSMLNGKSHFHDGYAIRHNPKIYKDNMIPHFDALVEPLKEHGIEIWNACPTSALEAFPKCTIDEAFRFNK